MTMFEQILFGWLLVALMMSVLWVYQILKKDAGIVDVGWAAGLGLLAILYGVFGTGTIERRVLVATLAALWSFRLAFYLLKDRVLVAEEDGRYQTLRADWGPSAQVRFFIFFQVQGILDIILSLPFLVLMQNSSPQFSIWEIVGVFVWIIAVAGESIADKQLSRFRSLSKNKGKTCREGLWRFSRHPNYFFEWVHWLSYVSMSVGLAYGWLTLISPLLIIFFILKVTGIPPTEARALESRGDDYRRYQESTSAFFPWFPKEERR